MSESNANIEILEAISSQLVLMTERFCSLSNAFQILIAEGKLDPFEFLDAIKRAGSNEYESLAQKVKADLRFEIETKTVN
jgi:hypothetical protein